MKTVKILDEDDEVIGTAGVPTKALRGSTDPKDQILPRFISSEGKIFEAKLDDFCCFYGYGEIEVVAASSPGVVYTVKEIPQESARAPIWRVKDALLNGARFDEGERLGGVIFQKVEQETELDFVLLTDLGRFRVTLSSAEKCALCGIEEDKAPYGPGGIRDGRALYKHSSGRLCYPCINDAWRKTK